MERKEGKEGKEDKEGKEGKFPYSREEGILKIPAPFTQVFGPSIVYGFRNTLC